MARSYLVTGASRGLGLEMVRQLSRRGERVIATARKRGTAEEAAGMAARFIELDVTDEKSVAKAAAELRGEAVDVLINNAGVTDTDKAVGELSAGAFRKVFEANVYAPALLTQALLPSLRAGKARVVANISSQLGSLTLMGQMGGGFSHAYCASKAALNMVTVRMAVDLKAEGFIVATIHPGWVKTDMGGPNAPLLAADSIAQLLGRIDRLKAGDTGKFFNYDGKPMPW